MRFRKRWLFLFLVVLVALPGFPPLIQWGVRQALAKLPYEVEWSRVSGYALTGLRFEQLSIHGPGLSAKLDEVRLGYNPVALLGGRLPLALDLSGGVLHLDPKAISLPAGTGGSARVRPELTRLRLTNVRLESAAWPRFALPPYRAEISGTLPRFSWKLETDAGVLTGELSLQQGGDWFTSFAGDLKITQFWWQGGQYGLVKGRFGYQKGHWLGEASVHSGGVTLAGFPVREVAGTVRYRDHVISSELQGRSLDGPVQAAGVVDVPGRNYRFKAEGRPQLEALLELWKVNLPAVGEGPLTIEGSGWERLHLKGRFQGQGRLLDRPLIYDGQFEFADGFTLHTEAKGSVPDRDWTGVFDWQDSGYTAAVRDDKGSLVEFSGEGVRYHGTGRVVWPQPLDGAAQVLFAGEGTRWQAQVTSPGVRLPLARALLDLSGSLEGSGMEVSGRLGPLALEGRWDNLALRLDPVPLVVGRISGSGRWRGAFEAELAYRSPYLDIPIQVTQEGARWRVLAGRFGEGTWADGSFRAKFEHLPIEALGGLEVSGEAAWTPQAGWSGRQRLTGPNLTLDGELAGNAWRFEGVADTPLGELPLSGTADATGVRGELDRAHYEVAPDRYRLAGAVRFAGGLRYEGDLQLRGGVWGGEARLSSPWEEVRLVGQGALHSFWSGYLEAEGRLWPEPHVDGVLRLPAVGDVTFAPQPVELRGLELRVGDGSVALEPPFAFSLTLPWSGYGYQGQLQATGDLRSGSLVLATPWGRAMAEGPWQDLQLSGQLRAPRIGQLGLSGRLDLPALGYEVQAALPDLDGSAQISGRAERVRWQGELQQGRLRFEGAGAAGKLEAEEFSSDALGLPGSFSGHLEYAQGWSGDLSFVGPLGRWRAHGLGTLQLEGAGPGYRSQGYLSASKLFVRSVIEAPYLGGELVVQGPWQDLKAVGEGVWRLPGVSERSWTFSAALPEGRWDVGGPLEIHGQGPSYQGRLDWKAQVAGRDLTLFGTFSGVGVAASGNFSFDLSGYRVRLGIAHDAEGWQASATAPRGSARFARGVLEVHAWELDPLGRALGVDLGGRLAGRIDLAAAAGSLTGSLRWAGERLGVVLRPRTDGWNLSLYDPARGLGVRWHSGKEGRLEGLGALEGGLMLRPAPGGALHYAENGRTLRVEGVAEGWRFSARQPGWTLSGAWLTDEAWLDLEGPVQGHLQLNPDDWTYRGRLRYRSSTADALLSFSGEKTQWSGNGYAVAYQGLPQAGPLTAEGQGLDWRVFWAAPMQVEASGSGPRVASWQLKGAADLGDLRRNAGHVRAALGYEDGKFTGHADWAYQGATLKLTAANERLNVTGSGFGLRLEGSVGADGRLRLDASGKGVLGRARWELAAKARGQVLKPELDAQAALTGDSGARIDARLLYRQGWRFEAEGPNLQLRWGPTTAQVEVNGLDLAPFVGVPLRVHAQGAGETSSLVLPLRLSGPHTELKGSWSAAAASLQLAGDLLGGRLDASWGMAGGRLRLNLPQPRVAGEVAYRDGRWSGGFDLDLTLPDGGLKGRLDAASTELYLQGYGAYSGALYLKPGRIEGELAGPAVRLSSDLLRIGSGWVGLLRLESLRWGGVQAVGEGTSFSLQGVGPLSPLSGRLSLKPWALEWAYSGALPDPLGELNAAGRWPGDAWAEGHWRILGHELELEGRAGLLHLRGDGLDARLRTTGPELKLEGFRFAGLSWSGRVGGDWTTPEIDLSAAGLHLSGRLGAQVSLAVQGWAQGRLVRKARSWSGRLRLPGGELVASGTDAWPRLEGTWQGERAELDYPKLRLGGLNVDLLRRLASGSVRLGRWSLLGEGERLRVAYTLEQGALVAGVALTNGRLRLAPEGVGEGQLDYDPGGQGFSGTLILEGVLPGKVIVRGGNRELEASWLHPSSDWLPWRKGRLDARIDLAGAWNASYRGGEVLLKASGDTRRAELELSSPWGKGSLRYEDGWNGSVRISGWPVSPLDAALDLNLTSAGGGTALVGELAGKAGRMSFNLRADSEGWLPRVDSAAFVVRGMHIEHLPKVLNRLPYASGSVDATLSYARGLWTGRMVSDGLTVAGETHPLELALYWSDQLKTVELNLGQSLIEARIEAARLDLRGELVHLPLHFLSGAWVGPSTGKAYWTGAIRGSVPLGDPLAGYGVLVGERLEFAGGGKRLVGTAALRYEGRTLYVDALDLGGDGSIRGSGYWGPSDADLTVEVKDTLLTPILGVVPQWRSYHPRAAGSLKLRAKGRAAWLEAEGLDVGITSLEGRIDRLSIEREAEQIRVKGAGEISRPYPAAWSVSGEGTEKAMTLQVDGSADLPLVGKLEGVHGSLKLPSGELDLRLADARLEGRLRPLALRLTGELPVAYPEYYLKSGRVRPDLLLTQSDRGLVLSGETEVVRAVLSRPESKQEVTFREQRYRYPLLFDRVRIYSNGGLLIQEPLAQGEAGGEVFLGGDLADPYLSGEVVGLRGEFLLGRHRFAVDQAWARFSPVSGLYPDIYLKAHTQLRNEGQEIELYLESLGRFLREAGQARLVLEPRLWAEAGGKVLPYTQEQLLGLLALGGQTNVAQGVASLAVQNLLISQLEYELARTLGLDLFTVQTNVFTGGGVDSTQFTVGKYLSPDLFVSYSVDLGGRQALGAEYRIDGLRLRVESELGGELLEPQVRFSMLYAIRPDLDLILKLRTGELRIGLEWRF